MDALSRDRARESVVKGCRYSAALYIESPEDEFTATLAAGSDGVVRLLVEGRADIELQTGLGYMPAPSRSDGHRGRDLTGVGALEMAVGGRLLLVGTAQGALRTYLWPPSQGVTPVSSVGAALAASSSSSAAPPLQEVLLHKGALTDLFLSPDGRWVITGGSDGAVFVLELAKYGEARAPVGRAVKETPADEARAPSPSSPGRGRGRGLRSNSPFRPSPERG